jgi:hypothetical protein
MLHKFARATNTRSTASRLVVDGFFSHRVIYMDYKCSFYVCFYCWTDSFPYGIPNSQNLAPPLRMRWRGRSSEALLVLRFIAGILLI